MWRWGRIYWLRVDNGSPFGDPTRQALSILHLCLVAHGVHLKVNPPRTPTKNAKVERNQGTTARWSEPGKCKDYLDLQEKLNEAVVDQREHYPTRVCQHQTRAQTYPALLKNKARFDPTDFRLDRVHQLLAKGKWKRIVSDRGSVDLFWASYQLGRKNRGKTVYLTLCPDQLQWEVFDTKGQKILAKPLKGLTQEQLIKGNKKL